VSILPPVPDRVISNGNNLTPPWEAWFRQLYNYLTASVAGGGAGIVTSTTNENVSQLLAMSDIEEPEPPMPMFGSFQAGAAGLNLQVQYNSGGFLAGSANFTFDGTTAAVNALTVTNAVTLTAGTANQVQYLNASKVLTGSVNLTFDGTNLATTGTASATKFIPTGGSATSNGMYLPAANTLAWSINGAEALRLTSAGFLGVGTVSPSYKLQVDQNDGGMAVKASAGTSAQLLLAGNGNVFSTTSFDFIQASDGTAYIYQRANKSLIFGTNNATVMTLDTAGNVTVPAMYATTVTTPRNVFIDSTGKMGGISSTRASKTNIAPLSDVSWLYKLEPVSFNYRKRTEDGAYLDQFESETQLGMIAEQVAPYAPDLCIYDDQGKVVGIHYDRMVAPLLKALQDQAARIEALEKKAA